MREPRRSRGRRRRRRRSRARGLRRTRPRPARHREACAPISRGGGRARGRLLAELVEPLGDLREQRRRRSTGHTTTSGSRHASCSAISNAIVFVPSAAYGRRLPSTKPHGKSAASSRSSCGTAPRTVDLDEVRAEGARRRFRVRGRREHDRLEPARRVPPRRPRRRAARRRAAHRVEAGAAAAAAASAAVRSLYDPVGLSRLELQPQIDVERRREPVARGRAASSPPAGRVRRPRPATGARRTAPASLGPRAIRRRDTTARHHVEVVRDVGRPVAARAARAGPAARRARRRGTAGGCVAGITGPSSCVSS